MLFKKPAQTDGWSKATLPAAPPVEIFPPDTRPALSAAALIARAELARVPVPEGFDTNLSVINKGADGHA